MKTFLSENGTKNVKFAQYPKGRDELGGKVEIMVKLVKKLLYAAIGKSIPCYTDF